MDPERWQRIDKILEEALEQEEGQRAAFLDQACGSDEGLREKVEALLDEHKQAENFLEEPALEVVAKELAKDQVESLVGQRLGSYKILSLIGTGGMGEVYRAQDTKLEREVAIKALPAEFSNDPQRLARFEREAKFLASLNHPNIAAIHGLEEAEGVRFLVLELVEGATLGERTAKGALPLEEGLEICRQIAEGLEAAHEKGIIHRDLKPANVKITPEGKVKILDFGIAKAFEGEALAVDPSQSPTLTHTGMILGTAAYMSPEQARGKPADKRADIWAFGCLLYEVLTGQRAFGGASLTEILARVMESEPQWDTLPKTLPNTIRFLLSRCLKKDPHRRLQHIDGARILIEETLTEPAELLPIGIDRSARPFQWRRAIPWGIALAMTVAAGVSFWSGRSPAAEVLKKFVIPPEASISLPDLPPNDLAISPDGKRIAYRGEDNDGVQQLYLRSIGELNAAPLSGSEGVSGSPFFSPDGESVAVGLTTRSGRHLARISLTGGPPIILCDLPMGPVNGNWSPEDIIVFSPDYGIHASLYRISAAGGDEPEILAEPNLDDGEIAYRYPELLPGGEVVIFTLQDEGGFQIAVLTLDTREQKIVIEGGKGAHYSPTGHLIYALPSMGNMMAVPFSLVDLEVTGSPVEILERVREHPWSVSGADYAFSEEGTLVYIPAGQRVKHNLVWVDREGRETPVTEGRDYLGPRVSPDGKRVAFGSLEAGESNVWIYNLESDSFSRLTFEARKNAAAEWSPDGQWIIFASTREGPQDLYRKRVDGIGPAERLTAVQSMQAASLMASSWSRDGSLLTFSDPTTNSNWTLQLDGDRELQRLDINGSFPVFSPNGKFLAYSTGEKGGWSVYVSLYGQPETRWLVSGDEGGLHPVWSPDGTELFYRSVDKMMVVPVQTEPTFSHGRPRVLFEGFYLASAITPAYRYYDISPDGKQFLMIKEAGTERSQINVVLNWFEELKRLVPTNP